jgi:glycosyltransferase involved in cell wall biosynthesis
VQLTAQLRSIQPDIVHLSTPKAALLGAIAATLAGVPIRVAFLRGSVTFTARGLARQVYRLTEWLTAALCHEVICVSRSLQDYLREEGILPPGRGRVIQYGMSNGINTTYFQPQPAGTASPFRGSNHQMLRSGRSVIGYVGRLTREKGIEDLAAAWRILREEHQQLLLLLVGDWEEGDCVSHDIRQALQSDPRVFCTGFVQDPRPYYQIMSVFVFPSHREGFPNAPMEAAAMELPVVATRVIGCVDAVQDGVTGTLVAPGDPQALGTAVSNYLHDPELRRRHGRAGRKRVEGKFQPEQIWEELVVNLEGWLQRCNLPLPQNRRVTPHASKAA